MCVFIVNPQDPKGPVPTVGIRALSGSQSELGVSFTNGIHKIKGEREWRCTTPIPDVVTHELHNMGNKDGGDNGCPGSMGIHRALSWSGCWWKEKQEGSSIHIAAVTWWCETSSCVEEDGKRSMGFVENSLLGCRSGSEGKKACTQEWVWFFKNEGRINDRWICRENKWDKLQLCKPWWEPSQWSVG